VPVPKVAAPVRKVAAPVREKAEPVRKEAAAPAPLFESIADDLTSFAPAVAPPPPAPTAAPAPVPVPRSGDLVAGTCNMHLSEY